MRRSSSSAGPRRRGTRIRSRVTTLLLALMIGVMPLAAGFGSADRIAAQDANTVSATAEAVPEQALFYLSADLSANSSQLEQAQRFYEQTGLIWPVRTMLAQLVTRVASVAEPAVESMTLDAGEIGFAAVDLHFLSPRSFDEQGAAIIAPGTPDASDGDADQLSGAAVIIQADDPDAILEEIQAGQSMPGLVETSEHNTIAIISMPPAQDVGSSGISLAAVDEFLLAAASPQDLAPFIDTALGQAASLAQSASFGEVVEALPEQRLVTGYVNTALLDPAIATASTVAGLPVEIDLAFEPNGGVGFAIHADEVGWRFESVVLPLPGEAFESTGQAADLTFSERVPSSAPLMINGFGLGSSLVMQTVAQVVVAFFSMAFDQGAATAMATPAPDIESQYRLLELLLGFHVQDDLLSQLTGEYGFALTTVDAADPSRISALLMSETADAATVATTLTALNPVLQSLGATQFSMTSRLVEGDTVTGITVPIANQDAVTIEYGVVSDEFVLGLGPAIDGYVSDSVASLAADPGFQASLSHLPAEHDGIFFLNMSGLLDLPIAVMVGSLPGLEPGLVAALIPAVETMMMRGDFALVSYKEDGIARASGILLIGD